MKPTQVNFLLRPWKTFKDGTLFYGTSKVGSKRHPLTSKQGNKNFYKGTRSSGIGSHTAYGKYTINWDKVRTYVVPTGLSNTDFTPYACQTAPLLKHTFKGYKRAAVDGNLYIKKVQEYIEYGENESPEAMRDIENSTERG